MNRGTDPSQNDAPQKQCACKGAARTTNSVRVRCSGTFHTVAMTKRGQLALLNHTPDEIRRNKDYIEIGGEPCPCVRLLLNWRQWVHIPSYRSLRRVPISLRATLVACQDRHETSALAKQEEDYKRKQLTKPYRDRISTIGRLMTHLYRTKCGGRRDFTCDICPDDDDFKTHELILRQGDTILGGCRFDAEGAVLSWEQHKPSANGQASNGAEGSDRGAGI